MICTRTQYTDIRSICNFTGIQCAEFMGNSEPSLRRKSSEMKYFQSCLSSYLPHCDSTERGGGVLRSIEFKFVMIVIASFRNVLRGGGGGGGDGRADSRVIIFTWSRSGHALVMLWSCSLLSHFIELCDRLLHCIIARTSTRRNFIFYR